MRLLVATVQRTGTRQLLAILAPDGARRAVFSLDTQRLAGEGDVVVTHLLSRSMEEILGFGGPILTTRRPEADVRASWQRLGWDERELAAQFENHRLLLAKRKPYILELGCR